MTTVRELVKNVKAVEPFSSGSPSKTVISVDDMQNSAIGYQSPIISNPLFNGEKFIGGFGDTFVYDIDYYVLRKRSAQLFEDNMYARGVLRRLLTNEINTGLTPEAVPEEMILGVEDDSLNEWTDEVETRFSLYSNDKELCDYTGQMTFGEIQKQVRLQSFVDGDVLVVLRNNPSTGMPSIQLIDGNAVVDPMTDGIRKGNTVEYGVELDRRRRHVAYWVIKNEGGYERIPCYGSRSGRRTAWLVYGCEKRLHQTRGVPALGLILQSLRDIDRYRDSAQRKALVESFLTVFFSKENPVMSAPPMAANSVRKQTVLQNVEGTNSARQYKIQEHIPGLILDDLPDGVKPHAFNSSGVNIAFGQFEETIMAAIAWALEIPPQILTLDFSNSYSAAQAAGNEFKLYLNRFRQEFTNSFCQPIYEDWLISSVIAGRIKAEGFLESWVDPSRQDDYNAWVQCDWSGAIKPSVDMGKQVKAYKEAVNEGWTTNDSAAKELFGKKYAKNVKRLMRENQMKADARKPLTKEQSELKGKSNG